MTGISIVVGPPGAGKGLHLVRVALETLLYTEQVIVSNFAIDNENLNVWLQANYPEKTIDLHERIYRITDEEIKKFYLIRGPGRRLQGVTPEQEKEDVFADYSPCSQWPSVCYILDEADIMFGAREYAKHGRSVNFYNKQHRKLGDRVVFCCQAVAQLDKQIRLLAQTTIVLKNLGKLKAGIFRLPKVFSWSQYYQVPDRSSEPLVTGTFTLSGMKGLQDCFQTQAGVGLIGTGADRNEKIKGFSVWWLLVPAVLILAAVFNGPKIGAWLARRASGPEPVRIESKAVAPSGSHGARQVVVPSAPAPAPAPGPGPAGAAVPAAPAAPAPEKAKDKEPVVHMTGYAKINGDWRVYLSDGQQFSVSGGDVQFVSPRYAIINGRVYYPNRAVVAAPAAAAPAVVPAIASDPAKSVVYEPGLESDFSTWRVVVR